MKDFMGKLFLIVLLFTQSLCFTQTEITNRTKEEDTIIAPKWLKGNSIGLDLGEIYLQNWSAGGVSTFSSLLKANFYRIYSGENVLFFNEIVAKYGINRQEETEWRKTEDLFRIESNFGYRRNVESKWYLSSKFTFNTQFSDGYAYPNVEKPISRPMAPAYMFLGVGTEYSNPKQRVSVYLSPLTNKTTFVLDQTLADGGSFGVKKAEYDADGNKITDGELTKKEIGIYTTFKSVYTIWTNIDMKNDLILYTDYLNKFGNIDVDWKLELIMKVNDYVKANLGIQMLYDDDIKNKKTVDTVVIVEGPKLQVKQTLTIGLVYEF